MESITKPIVLALALAAVPGLMLAAEPSPSVKSPTPTPTPWSAFEGYRSLIDEPMRPWRDANDEVARLRGHIGHIGSDAGTPDRREPGAAATAPRLGTGNADKAWPGGHSGHHR